MGDIPALLPEAHEVGVHGHLGRVAPQAGDEISQGNQGLDQRGFRHTVHSMPACMSNLADVKWTESVAK